MPDAFPWPLVAVTVTPAQDDPDLYWVSFLPAELNVARDAAGVPAAETHAASVGVRGSPEPWAASYVPPGLPFYDLVQAEYEAKAVEAVTERMRRTARVSRRRTAARLGRPEGG